MSTRWWTVLCVRYIVRVDGANEMKIMTIDDLRPSTLTLGPGGSTAPEEPLYQGHRPNIVHSCVKTELLTFEALKYVLYILWGQKVFFNLK